MSESPEPWRAAPIEVEAVPDRPPAADAAVERDLARLRRFARLMDASIGVPGTSWRIGVDPLVGLVPVVGDWIGVGLSGWIVYQAQRLGARRSTRLRMLGNLGLEATVGAIPILGDVFDAWFRANQRNVCLLERDLGRERKT